MGMESFSECLHCNNFFKCKGRPSGISRCIGYVDRDKKLKNNDEKEHKNGG